jgi:hypothetical protein
VYAADEYYLLAGRSFPALETYGVVAQHENGVGMARAFEARFHGRADAPAGGPGGFFQSVDGAPAAGYRAPRGGVPVALRGRPDAPVTVLTGTYGAAVIRPLLPAEVEVVPVPNRFFGGNIGVTGLLTGADFAAALAAAPPHRRYLLPDVCLSGGRFLDGLTPADLPRPVELVRTDGAALRAALGG